MKKTGCFLALLLTAALLAGCGSQPGYEPPSDPSPSYSTEEPSSAPDPSSSEEPSEEPDSSAPNPEEPAPAAVVTEPPLTEWVLMQPIPDFLNNEQRQLFLHAYCAASEIFMGGSPSLNFFPLADGSMPPDYPYETVELDGWEYAVAHGRYRLWSDFQAMMDGLFTPEYQQELIRFPMEDGSTLYSFRPTEDGLLCYLDFGRGSDIFYDGIDTDTYELVSQTKDEICFDLIGHYTEWDYDPVRDEEVPGKSYTERYPIRMVRTDQGWRVTEIHIPW